MKSQNLLASAANLTNAKMMQTVRIHHLYRGTESQFKNSRMAISLVPLGYNLTLKQKNFQDFATAVDSYIYTWCSGNNT